MERRNFKNKKGENFSYLADDTSSTDINLVFFHATGFNANTYRILLEKMKVKFEKKINIYALDQRGHGLSLASAEPSTLKSWNVFVEDGMEFIDSLEGHIICCGHSMGSIVAAKIASILPGRVSHLFMIEPVLYGPWESLKFRFFSLIRYNRKLTIADGAAKRRSLFNTLNEAKESYAGRGAFTTWTEEWIENYLEGGMIETNEGMELSCSPAWESATFRSSSMDTWKYLKQIKIKVLVSYGNFGSTFSAQARKVLFKLGSNWNSRYHPKSSHFLPMEFSDLVIQDLEDYIQNH